MVNDEQQVKKDHWRMAEGNCRPVVAVDNHLNNIKQEAIELAEQIKLCENRAWALGQRSVHQPTYY